MACLYDGRWSGSHGIGRFASELGQRLDRQLLVAGGQPMSPFDPFRLSISRYSRDQWFLSPGYNAPFFDRLPYVVTVHDLNHIDRIDNSGVLKRIYYGVVLRRIVKAARAVLTVSEFSRARIVEWFGIPADKVFNVGNGVSIGFRPDGARHSPTYEYFLCVSNRRGHKNELGLLQAFARSNSHRSVKLIFTGEATSELLAHAAALGIGSRLVFSGRVTEEGLAELYRGALSLVFPSLYEGFGLPIVEAFACGTPVITSNVTSMPEIAGDAALLVDPTSVNEIAAAMDQLYAHPELREELSRKGMLRAQAFSWDSVAERVRAAVRAVDTDPARPLSWD
jgi:glycosyltransferase involved in cell wall biosynthesis